MKKKEDDMKEIFSQLSEDNKDFMILLASNIKVAQESEKQK